MFHSLMSLWYPICSDNKKIHGETKREREPEHVLTVFSFSTGISKTHLSLESISSSGLASFHWIYLIKVEGKIAMVGEKSKTKLE